MSYSRRSRYSRSPSPCKRDSRSISRSLSRSRSHDFNDAENPGNNLYVTGLSSRVSKRDLEKHFSTEGKVEDVRLVVDPWTQESRGFGFVTMSTVEEANRCIKYLDCSVIEGRVIIVEKARRRRGRTPTPGRYCGLRTVHRHRRSPSYARISRSFSPCYSSERDRSRSRSYSPCYSRRRQSYSSHHQRRLYSPYYRRGTFYSLSRSPSYSRSPVSRRDSAYSRDHSPSYSRSPVSRRDWACSPHYYQCYSPDQRYRRHYRSTSWVLSPDNHNHRSRYRPYSRSNSPRLWRNMSRSYSCSLSPRHSRRSYSRSASPNYSRRYSISVSVSPRKRSVSPGSDKQEISGSSGSNRSHSRSPC